MLNSWNQPGPRHRRLKYIPQNFASDLFNLNFANKALFGHQINWKKTIIVVINGNLNPPLIKCVGAKKTYGKMKKCRFYVFAMFLLCLNLATNMPLH